MQAGEVIWLLAGIGIGLTVAIAMFVVVAFVDGQQIRRRADRSAAAAERPAVIRETKLPKRPEPKPLPVMRRAEPEPQAVAEAAPVPSAPRPAAPEPVVADARSAEPATQIVDDMMSDFAAEIARVQSSTPETVETPPPEPEPVPVIVDLLPVEETPVAVPPEVTEAPAEVSEPVAVVQSPKVPPLPKVPPARKFAPALPPRDKPGA